MLLLPLIYLKNQKAVQPIERNPTWFREDPLALAQVLAEQGAQVLYINDLNIPGTGKSPNLENVESILKTTSLKIWITGSFKSIPTIEAYVSVGVDKIVLGASAYQNPILLKEAIQKFEKRIAVLIEVKNKKVVIPGLVTPSHKSALDYAKQFEELEVASLVLSDSDTNGVLNEENEKAIREFLNHCRVPVLLLCDIQTTEDLKKLFEYESAGLVGVVLNKTLYENRLDLHSSIAFLNDLAATTAAEITLKP